MIFCILGSILIQKTETKIMFLEQNVHNYKNGWIEVVCGSMFSGKTEELLRRIRRAKIAHLKTKMFKPMVDTRYDEEAIVSHDAHSIASTPVSNSLNILKSCNNVDVVGIDEAQFFDENLPEVCTQLANKGVRIIAAGLDKDFQGKPFGIMPQLMAIAEYVTKIHAICVQCGNLANFSYRLVNNKNVVLLGEKENYEPRCRRCFNGSQRQAVHR
jgi:thymidine kinase